ncbi:MAG TPA: hypothetical protein VL866_21895 [Pyrinomonadaceae bacterium]|nr:hypothetical protein [Pyrinomonadaceae bacterium]
MISFCLLAALARVVYTEEKSKWAVINMVSKSKNQPPVDNSISDSTGQYDLRFLLWRQFCSENGIPVDTLPSQLNDDQKNKWEKMKSNRLR